MRNPRLTMVSAVGAAVFALAGCQLLGSETTLEASRIHFGHSIDGIEVGTDSSAVVEKLGRPDFIVMGDFEGWIFAYAYPIADGPGYRDSLAVTMVWNPDDEAFGVVSVMVQGPYSGQTAEGISLGSTREAARYVWGRPDETQVDHALGRRVDVYMFAANVFEIRYAENKITSITLRRRR